MLDLKETGMLFFIYNSDIISVLVCHDIERGEFVLQVPYFPPIENISDYKNKDKCLDIIRKTFFSPSLHDKKTF